MNETIAFRRLLFRRLALIAAAALPAAAMGCDDKQGCFAWTEAEGACPAQEEAAAYLGNPSCEERLVSVDSDGEFADGLCCYDITTESHGGCVIEGRPLWLGGAARAARAVRGGDGGWAAALPGAAGAPEAAASALSDGERAALAAHWTRAALMEHASIAEFSRCALELLALGAPAELVAAAHEAALDEVAHARAAFALASAYAGASVGPSALPLGGRLSLRRGLAEVAAATARDGCVNETLAALLAAEQRAHATDPAVRAALAVIAEDEARHAELAWRTVRWALAVGGAPVRRAVAAAFAEAQAARVPAEGPLDGVEGRLAAHGLLDRETAQAAIARGLAEVVRPCAEALLGRWAAAGAGDVSRPGGFQAS